MMRVSDDDVRDTMRHLASDQADGPLGVVLLITPDNHVTAVSVTGSDVEQTTITAAETFMQMTTDRVVYGLAPEFKPVWTRRRCTRRPSR